VLPSQQLVQQLPLRHLPLGQVTAGPRLECAHCPLPVLHESLVHTFVSSQSLQLEPFFPQLPVDGLKLQVLLVVQQPLHSPFVMHWQVALAPLPMQFSPFLHTSPVLPQTHLPPAH
jgi:hypothetical protein